MFVRALGLSCSLRGGGSQDTHLPGWQEPGGIFRASGGFLEPRPQALQGNGPTCWQVFTETTWTEKAMQTQTGLFCKSE